ncbi:MAG: hypothetical protein SVO01_00550 [Thermotogota bacterium]|nr:hypothetical protein [Thermotogota bacterium]
MFLNKNRPYGAVVGSANHSYEQDGKHYDHRGILIKEDGSRYEDVSLIIENISSLSRSDIMDKAKEMGIEITGNQSKQSILDILKEHLDNLG